MRNWGWRVTANVTEPADVLFTNSWMTSYSRLCRAIRHSPGIRIIHRIDGSAADYGRFDDADPRQAAVNVLADATIFQSEYSRYSTREKHQVVAKDGPVIHNPVDLDLFSPEGLRLDLAGSVRVACVTWSTNPMKGARSVYRMAETNPDVTFHLAGRFPEAPSLPNLTLCGVLDRQGLARHLRSCHVLLTFSQNEACPNHVLEAMASGLPVLYHDSGAMAEVVGAAGLPTTEEIFAENLSMVKSTLDAWSHRARERAIALFSPKAVFQQYRSVIETALRDDALDLEMRLQAARRDRLRRPLRCLRDIMQEWRGL
jgi:glycosyltransferase involved in cell wall biosynthesis